MRGPLAEWSLRERLALAVVAATLGLLGWGAWAFGRRGAPVVIRAPGPESVVIEANPKPTPSPAPTPRPRVVVYVTGAVRRPGVYVLRAGDRVFQATAKAGGFSRQADREALNLAAPLRDADHVRVPRKTERAPLASAVVAPPAMRHSGAKLQRPGDGAIDLNAATAAELARLPGVGPSTAQAILEYRAQAGRFAHPEEVKNVRGIGEKKFAKMAPFLIVR